MTQKPKTRGCGEKLPACGKVKTKLRGTVKLLKSITKNARKIKTSLNFTLLFSKHYKDSDSVLSITIY